MCEYFLCGNEIKEETAMYLLETGVFKLRLSGIFDNISMYEIEYTG